MSPRSRVVRALTWFGLVCGAILALASIVVLNRAVLLALVFAAALAAVLAYGIRDDGRPPSLAMAWKAAAGTVVASMVVTGLVVLVGGFMAAVACTVGFVAGGAAWTWRRARGWSAAHGAGNRSRPRRATVCPAPVSSAGWPDRSASPVSLLSVPVLGTEWRRMTAVLACGPDPAAQQAVVRRRQEVLDELERRDRSGFARWLATGTAYDSDPADFLKSGPIAETDAV
jgi:hypothetical protein